MEKYCKKGLLKSIGVSDFYPFMPVNFSKTVEGTPAVNQIEIHPFS